MATERHYVPPMAELVDRLTVDQLKEMLLPDVADEVAKEIAAICTDIEQLIAERQIPLSARLVRTLIALSQINAQIWNLKDRMKLEPEHYGEHLKLAHQLNGLRNQLKNRLLVELQDPEGAAARTNFDTDGLQGWRISL